MKKALNVVKNILVWLIVAVAVFMMIFTVVSVNFFDKNDRNIFGYKFFIVQTDSMSATDFDAGDIIISKNVDITTIKEGDIIFIIAYLTLRFSQTVSFTLQNML